MNNHSKEFEEIDNKTKLQTDEMLNIYNGLKNNKKVACTLCMKRLIYE